MSGSNDENNNISLSYTDVIGLGTNAMKTIAEEQRGQVLKLENNC